MKTVKLTIVRLILLVCVGAPINFISCADDLVLENQTSLVIREDEDFLLKKEFSMALAKALARHIEVRDFIKNEALKKFDHDYDVLYLSVKNVELKSGLTLEKALLEYIEAETLAQIEEKLPTLTVFVPELPENSFSAESWNVTSEVPLVGVRDKCKNDVLMFDSNENETILKGDMIPMFPVLVVKESERVVVTNKRSSSNIQTRSNTSTKFEFLDDIFNNMGTRAMHELSVAKAEAGIDKPHEKMGTDQIESVNTSVVPENLKKLLDAYDAYNGIRGWQRDYIYYNLSPTNTVGPFDDNFKEHIVGFEMVGDGNMNVAKISDQSGDPSILSTTQPGRSRVTYWTDGEFEFKVKVYLGNKSAFGNELTTHFRLKPSELFDVRFSTGQTDPKALYITHVNNKKASFFLPLFQWDLDNYSANIKIAIEEVDASETIKQTSSTTTEYATNFGYSAEIGKTVKMGLEFGSTTKESRTTSYEVSTTYGNDELGEVIINFGDKVITSREVFGQTPGRRTRDVLTLDYNQGYSNGWYRLYIAPVKIIN